MVKKKMVCDFMSEKQCDDCIGKEAKYKITFVDKTTKMFCEDCKHELDFLFGKEILSIKEL